MRLTTHPLPIGLLSCLSLVFIPATASGAWVQNGTPIWPDRVGSDVASLSLSMVPDGAGGSYLASGNGRFNARLSRILSTGAFAAGWPGDGLYFSGGNLLPFETVAIPDGMGGVFLLSDVQYCAAHCAGNSTEARVQRVTPGGSIAPGWPAEGVSIGTGLDRPLPSFDIRQATAVANGHGAALVTWARRQSIVLGPSPVELRAQLVAGDGALPWGYGGVLVHPFAARRYDQAMAPDGLGGAYVFWLDERDPGLFGQHISEDGRMLWAPNGMPIATLPSTFVGRPVAISDGSHGAIVAWAGTSGALAGIFAARVTPNGALRWRGRGLVFDAGALQLDGLRMIPTPTAGAILAWRATGGGGEERVLAQRLDHEGRRLWANAGAPVCEAVGSRDQIVLATDHRGGAYLAWVDSRPGFSVFGAHLGPDGVPVQGWPRDGAPVCARMPLAFAGGGTADVSNLAISTLVGRGARAHDDCQVESIEPDDLELQASVPGAASRDDADASHNAGRAARRDAGAIIVWVDNRRQACAGCDYAGVSPFAMLLTPHGPATAPVATPSAPILVSQPAYSRSPSSSPPPSLTIGRVGAGLMHLSLPEASAASLELFDLAGRRLWSREVGELGPGEHELRLGDGTSYPSGIYLARLMQGGRIARARIAVIH